MSFMGRLMNAVTGFREGWSHADDPGVAALLADGSGFDTWGRFEARAQRYAVNWAFWQNDAYRKIHTFSKQMKAEFGLYDHTRPIYNPSRRTAEFFVCHVY